MSTALIGRSPAFRHGRSRRGAPHFNGAGSLELTRGRVLAQTGVQQGFMVAMAPTRRKYRRGTELFRVEGPTARRCRQLNVVKHDVAIDRIALCP